VQRGDFRQLPPSPHIPAIPATAISRALATRCSLAILFSVCFAELRDTLAAARNPPGGSSWIGLAQSD